jgi:hypothetical protein
MESGRRSPIDTLKGRSQCNSLMEGQVTKGWRWMPWQMTAMKDVVSCEKSRGVARERWSGNVRMGKPGWVKAQSSLSWIHRLWEANVGKWTISVPTGTENNSDSGSSGERNRRSPNLLRVSGRRCVRGVVGPTGWGCPSTQSYKTYS